MINKLVAYHLITIENGRCCSSNEWLKQQGKDTYIPSTFSN